MTIGRQQSRIWLALRSAGKQRSAPLSALRAILKFTLCGIVLLGLSAFSAARAQQTSVMPVAGPPALILGEMDLSSLGYQVREYFVSGEATAYVDEGDVASPSGARAPYRTRIVVIAPVDERRFNGAVVVEWMNVTAGQDTAPGWSIAHRELLRSGYAYVGVSAQRLGIEGGQSVMGAQSTGLRQADPERYGSLRHPGDQYSYDIFSQIGALLRGPNSQTVLGRLQEHRLIATGESQSARYLTAYVKWVDPLARVYDGFLIHARSGVARLDTGRVAAAPAAAVPTTYTSLRVPVFTIETETDVTNRGAGLGYFHARQPDSDRLRVWEIAGAAHADGYMLGTFAFDTGSATTAELARGFTPTDSTVNIFTPRDYVPAQARYAFPANTGQSHHYVYQAALSHLNVWIRDGLAPPRATPFRVTGGQNPQYVLDRHGHVRGGVRSPWVDVPVVRLRGVGNSGPGAAALIGVAEPYDQATLARLYPRGRAQYLSRFTASLDSAIRNGFILPADRQEILDVAVALCPFAD